MKNEMARRHPGPVMERTDPSKPTLIGMKDVRKNLISTLNELHTPETPVKAVKDG